MGRLIIILLVIYLVLLLLKSVLKIWRGNSLKKSRDDNSYVSNRAGSKFDKSKAVDAEFEEIN